MTPKSSRTSKYKEPIPLPGFYSFLPGVSRADVEIKSTIQDILNQNIRHFEHKLYT
jgi:hypothetical protein